MKIYPSIASGNVLNLQESLDKTEGWPLLHIDIEDGNFVSNISFGMKTVKAICKAARNRSIDVHMMANDPLNYLEELAACGVSSVCAHLEALDYPMVFLNRARSLGMKAGLALNMKTPVIETEIFWPVMDYLLLMTSEPEGGSETLYEPAFKRAIKAAALLPKEVKLMVDGGITADRLPELSKADIYGVVMGREVFSHEDPYKKLLELSNFI